MQRLNRAVLVARPVALCALLLWLASLALPQSASAQEQWRPLLVMGRVADAQGQGIPGANVHLIAHEHTVGPRRTRIVGRTRTDPHGEFSFQTRTAREPRRGPYYAVRATWRGLSRTVLVQQPSLVEIRIGPTRTAQLDVQCTGAAPTREPQLYVRWAGDWGNEYWMQGAVIPVARVRGQARLLSPSENWGNAARVRPGETRFAARLQLPVGRNTLTFHGSCGAATHTVDIPANGAVPAIEVQLRQVDPDSGGIDVFLPDDNALRGRVLSLRSGATLVGRYAVEPYVPTRMEGLPAGTYEVVLFEGRQQCQRSVTVQDGVFTRVTMPTAGCE